MKRTQRIKKITGIAVFMALTIALQCVAPLIKIGFVEIALGLIPMILGACIYGPLPGLLLGLTLGSTIMLSPDTLTYFMPVNPAMTVILCLVKTGLAGFVSAVLYRVLKSKKSLIRIGVSTFVAPVINTGLFILGVLLFFLEVYGGSVVAFFTTTLLINFLIELSVMVILVPAFERILKLYGKKLLPDGE